MSDQLAELSRPFPDRWISTKPGKFKASYVEHSVVAQRLLEVLGPYSTEVVEVVRGAADTDNGMDPDAVLGVVLSLTVTIDGREVTVTEAGDCGDNYTAQHDGQRLKDAMSDALKRCAMRIGVGLHLWAQDNYYLDKALAKRSPEREGAEF